MEITETRMKPCLVRTEKEREETYTAFRLVPEKREYKQKSCHLATEIKTQDVVTKQCRLAEVPVTLTDEVKQPVQEVRAGVRRHEACTKCGKVCIEEPCTCVIDRAVEVPRSQNYCRTEVVFEECQKTIDYCVKTPKFEEEVCAVENSFRVEPVEKKRTVTVCVPEIVERPCDYKVMRMVQQKVCCCPCCYESFLAERERKSQCNERCEQVHEVAENACDRVGKCVDHCKECAKKLAPAKVAECVGKHLVALNPLKLLPCHK